MVLYLRSMHAINACASSAYPSHGVGKDPLETGSRLRGLPAHVCLVWVSLHMDHASCR